MPGIKDERDDSEGEEMDHDSDQSDKSTSSCDSSDASDSDDSSGKRLVTESFCSPRIHFVISIVIRLIFLSPQKWMRRNAKGEGWTA